jgi:hypothetical protein
VCSRAALRHTSHTRPSNSPSDQRQQRPQREQTQTGREASWLKQVRKVKRVEKSEKWVKRPWGGGVKTNLLEKQNENDWWEGKKSERGSKKDLITYVDKPTRYVGLG